jgi:tetratricopeptide (TPR) repeat protein
MNGGNNIGVINRPGNNVNSGNNIGVVNRPGNNVNSGNNFGVVNRPGNNVNSGNNIGVVNRPTTNVNVNRPTTNINTNVNNITNVSNTNVVANNRAGPPAWGARPGAGYHQGWVNGYWNGHNSNNWWGNGGAFATGMAVGGIGAWGIGSSIYGWGYQPYVNPFITAAPVVVSQPAVVVQQPVVIQQQPVAVAAAAPAVAAEGATYDYSQPLNTSAPVPAEAEADPALRQFDAARAAFKAGDYATALTNTDAALVKLPNDAAMHEFRSLIEFAQGKYDEAAATLYAVLSAGPGWDWTTLVGLYPGIDVYTTQLRALEAYRDAHPDSASAHFVLAYHYLTQGHDDDAVKELREVMRLAPTDQLSSELVMQLTGGASPTSGAATTAAPLAATGSPETSAASAPMGNLVGSWKASPAKDVTIALVVGQDGQFTWTVTQQGKSQPISGNYTYDQGVLTLNQAKGDPLAGTVAWQDDSHFTFQAQGGGPNDSGLAFSK